MNTTTSRTSRKWRLLTRLAALPLAALAFTSVSLSEPASAAAYIQGPGGLQCDRYHSTVSVGTPRVWASYGTEQVGWAVALERWNGSAWIPYRNYIFYSSFTSQGRSVTSWTGGGIVNNTMNLRVDHTGYYRVFSYVLGTQGGATWRGYVDGGAWCQVR
jgi:hypothetical protein